MFIRYCSVTGADDAVDPTDILALSKDHPFIEAAILWWPSRAGTPRYPTSEWIDGFLESCPDVNKAMHLCNEGLVAFANRDRATLKRIEGFSRIQLNVGFNRMADQLDMIKLVAAVESLPSTRFIFQTNEATLPNLRYFADIQNLDLLMDSSMGQGSRDHKFPNPIPGRRCGFAGGLGPDNILEAIDELESMLPIDYETWTDSETRMRINDQFQLSLAETFCAAVSARKPPVLFRPSTSLAKNARS